MMKHHASRRAAATRASLASLLNCDVSRTRMIAQPKFTSLLKLLLVGYVALCGVTFLAGVAIAIVGGHLVVDLSLAVRALLAALGLGAVFCGIDRRLCWQLSFYGGYHSYSASQRRSTTTPTVRCRNRRYTLATLGRKWHSLSAGINPTVVNYK